MKEVSLSSARGGISQAVSISTTSAQSAVVDSNRAVIYSTVDCFVRPGANPTALANGTDQFIPANTLLRIDCLSDSTTTKLAFITAAGTGTVYITPEK